MDDVIQVYTNNKGAQSIIYQKYSFRLFRKNKNSGDLVWRCNNKFCSVIVTTNSNINVFIKQNKSKHHHETNEINPELKEIRCAVKRKSKLDLNEKTLKIIRKELCTSSVSADNIDAMRQSMNRERRKLLPPVPVSLTDVLNKIDMLKQQQIITETKFRHIRNGNVNRTRKVCREKEKSILNVFDGFERN
ncbi:uncharacterized protein LOC112692150 isoform X2 [Sipha flava]|uniref:Uncharacterized protein LOC112692150 isoform X2 n=1 Tax=Sipha flava TaxID=143950 RepID=A0A2S2R473_9HEMI|nr:uncharacterized protein LOC112692150 isoform X2 [Sipha flava]